MESPAAGSSPTLTLRPVVEADLGVLFQQQCDSRANFMAAFTVEDPSDEGAFRARWLKLLRDDSVTARAAVVDCSVVGWTARFFRIGAPEVTYWLGAEYWGRGYATAMLAQLLETVPERPLFARVAHDNAASIRVLEKNHFTRAGTDSGFARARGEDVEEFVYRLDA